MSTHNFSCLYVHTHHTRGRLSPTNQSTDLPHQTTTPAGACGGELACSTCHVVFDPALYAKLPAKKEEEEDMLDLAWGLTDTCVTNNRCVYGWMWGRGLRGRHRHVRGACVLCVYIHVCVRVCYACLNLVGRAPFSPSTPTYA